MAKKNKITEVEAIPVEQIKMNNLNNDRSLDPVEIDMLAKSIESVGLFNPITVYYDLDDGYFTIVSGHKRLTAVKKLGLKTIDCIKVAPPKNKLHEKEMMLQANMHRNSDDDIKNEAQIAANIWDKMPKSLKDEYSQTYWKEYAAKNPDAKKEDFRPKNEYVLHMTGIQCSYRTIQKYMSNNDEVKEATKKPKKKKARDPKLVAKATIVEFEYITSPESELDIDIETSRKIQECIEALKELI